MQSQMHSTRPRATTSSRLLQVTDTTTVTVFTNGGANALHVGCNLHAAARLHRRQVKEEAHRLEVHVLLVRLVVVLPQPAALPHLAVQHPRTSIPEPRQHQRAIQRLPKRTHSGEGLGLG